MKILYIANSRLPTEKAHGLQIMKTIEALLSQGVSVTLLAPKRKNLITTHVKEFYSLKNVPKICYVPNYVGFLEKPFHHLYFSLQRFLFGLSAFFAGLFFKADVIYSREITISFFLSLFGKKVVFEDHEPKKQLLWLYRFFIMGIWKKVIVPEKLALLYRELGINQKSYTVVPNGVDLEEFDAVNPDREIWRKIGLSGREKIVLYVGHFYRWKGVYTLLDAAVFISNAKVVFIGGTETDRDVVLKYVKQKNLHNVIIHPFVRHKEIIKFIKSADVLVLPNTTEEERSAKFTTPIKLFEYMAAKVTIVASDLPSFSSYLDRNNSYLVRADHPRELGDVITVALNDGNSVEMALRAYAKVKNYTWKSRVINILDFILK